MRVAMVETGGWGGIGHYAWNLCEALAAAGVDVHLLTNSAFELASLPRRFQVEPCFTAGRRYLKSARLLLDTLDRLAPDIIHVQSLLSSRFDAFLWPAARRRAPLVMTAHNIRSHESSPWEAWTTWRSFRAADALVVHTAESVRIATRRLGVAPRGRLDPSWRVRILRARTAPLTVRRARSFTASLFRSAPAGIRCHSPLQGNHRTLPGSRPGPRTSPRCAPGGRRPAAGGDGVRVSRGHFPGGGLGRRGRSDPGMSPMRRWPCTSPQRTWPSLIIPTSPTAASLRIACSLGTPVVATAVGAFRRVPAGRDHWSPGPRPCA